MDKELKFACPNCTCPNCRSAKRDLAITKVAKLSLYELQDLVVKVWDLWFSEDGEVNLDKDLSSADVITEVTGLFDELGLCPKGDEETKRTSPNENCLRGMLCPKCDSAEPFSIHTTCVATMTDEGTEETIGHDWDVDSWCKCLRCGYENSVQGFMV